MIVSTLSTSSDSVSTVRISTTFCPISVYVAVSLVAFGVQLLLLRPIFHHKPAPIFFVMCWMGFVPVRQCCGACFLPRCFSLNNKTWWARMFTIFILTKYHSISELTSPVSFHSMKTHTSKFEYCSTEQLSHALNILPLFACGRPSCHLSYTISKTWVFLPYTLGRQGQH